MSSSWTNTRRRRIRPGTFPVQDEETDRSTRTNGPLAGRQLQQPHHWLAAILQMIMMEQLIRIAQHFPMPAFSFAFRQNMHPSSRSRLLDHKNQPFTHQIHPPQTTWPRIQLFMTATPPRPTTTRTSWNATDPESQVTLLSSSSSVSSTKQRNGKKDGKLSPIHNKAETTDDDDDESLFHDRIREIVHNRPEHLKQPSSKTDSSSSSFSDKQQQQPTESSASLTPNDNINGDTSTTTLQQQQQQQEEETLGDIMSSGLITKPRASLAATYGFVNPLDRMVLTANGNLQRLISSYYDSAVAVYVDSCEPRSGDDVIDLDKGMVPSSSQQQQQSSSSLNTPRPPLQTWDRVVHLTVRDQRFCTATSVIQVHDALCVTLVESGKIGLGQLFRYLDLLPEFSLVAAGRLETGGFWREYTLECAEVTCQIHEEFIDGLWDLPPPPEGS